jgi:hypothetical protein
MSNAETSMEVEQDAFLGSLEKGKTCPSNITSLEM